MIRLFLTYLRLMLKQPESKGVFGIQKKIRVVATTQNKEKLKAIRKSFEYHLKSRVVLTGVKSESGFPDGQPYGLSGTLQGCLQRIKTLEADLSKYDYLVSVENGIETMNTNDKSIHLYFPIVIITEVKSGHQSISLGNSREIPLVNLRHLKREGADEKERGKYIQNYYEKKNSTYPRGQIIETAILTCLEELTK
jgi:non-canonical (house-cleaning) NTP pyrophosphatase